jgi:hypothetical protein
MHLARILPAPNTDLDETPMEDRSSRADGNAASRNHYLHSIASNSTTITIHAFLSSFGPHSLSELSAASRTGRCMSDRVWMTGCTRRRSVAITAKVLEQCLDRVALLITESGDNGGVYLPVYDRLEAELEAIKAKEDRMARIRARIRR